MGWVLEALGGVQSGVSESMGGDGEESGPLSHAEQLGQVHRELALPPFPGLHGRGNPAFLARQFVAQIRESLESAQGQVWYLAGAP